MDLTIEGWALHLTTFPEDTDKCDKWDEFNGKDWRYLLEKQPQFAEKRK